MRRSRSASGSRLGPCVGTSKTSTPSSACTRARPPSLCSEKGHCTLSTALADSQANPWEARSREGGPAYVFSELGVVALEVPDPLPDRVRNGNRLPLIEVDQN